MLNPTTQKSLPCIGMLSGNMLLLPLTSTKAWSASTHSGLSVTSAATCSTFFPQPRAFPLSGFCREVCFMRHHLASGKGSSGTTPVQRNAPFPSQCLRLTLVPARTLMPLGAELLNDELTS